jgi:hypothetical protein
MKVFARLSVVGLFVGAAIVPVSQPVHADVALLSGDDPLSGSDTAIIVGGTFESTPTASFAHAVENLYLDPLGFAGGATDSTVCDMVATDPCAAPLQVLTTPELLQQGPSSLTGASDIVLAVENEFNADPGAFNAEHPLTVFGYSQSATAESIAMTELAAAHIPLGDVHFVFIGDPSLPEGIMPNLEADLVQVFGSSFANDIISAFGLQGALGVLTPDDLYQTTIYTVDTDGVADWQEDYDAGGMNAGGFLDAVGHILEQHAEYLGLTPSEVADATTSINGDLTYVDISDNVNSLSAVVGALDAGLLSSGFLQSLLGSLELAFTNSY